MGKLSSMTATLCIHLTLLLAGVAEASSEQYDYRVLATSKTSTMQEEMNEAAASGFRFQAVMGGETAFGGRETVAVMVRFGEEIEGRYEYRLLATSKTSTMQQELQEAADAGYRYVGQTVFKSRFGGDEVVVILERDRTAASVRHEYRLLATLRTSTLDKELQEAGREGFVLRGLTVGETRFGGSEVLAILERLDDESTGPDGLEPLTQ